MSRDWVKDIHEMHDKYGVIEWMSAEKNKHLNNEFLKFRLQFLYEELQETTEAWTHGNSEEIVDGLIDLCVVAIGTLDAFGVDAYTAWDKVLTANMNKQPGVKLERSNPLGLPDLIKPDNWEAPSHKDNHGQLSLCFD
jgi:NTP pyrophosphatase (non-canonical NTP hydrolase)